MFPETSPKVTNFLQLRHVKTDPARIIAAAQSDNTHNRHTIPTPTPGLEGLPGRNT